MTEQELIKKLSSLKDEIRPSQEWLKQSEKELLNQMPRSQWPIYSLVIVLVLVFAMVGTIHESPERPMQIVEQEKDVVADRMSAQKTEISVGLEKIVSQVKSVKKELAKSVQKQEEVLATKIRRGEDNQIDARVKLIEEIEKLENIEEVSELLEAAKEEYGQGNFVIAQELVRQAQEILDNLGNK